MQAIQQLRDNINQMDIELVKLLNKRAELAKQIGLYKQQLGQGGYKDSSREEAVIDRICHLNSGPLSNDAMAVIYRTIMMACLELQQQQN